MRIALNGRITTPIPRPAESVARNRVEGALAHETIAKRAYQIWEASGRVHGEDQEHWFQAERELSTSPFAARTPPH